jgi:NAD(P)-dependent dehydrogenase (short-subunit alcohol dehydrogenase family)
MGRPLGIQVTAVEPGYFRTDFLDPASLVTNDAPIADYHETSGAMRSDALAALEGKIAGLTNVVQKWRATSVSTDFASDNK